jgi:hypothetical protein
MKKIILGLIIGISIIVAPIAYADLIKFETEKTVGETFGAIPALRPYQGGTGTTTAPSYGQLLLGQSDGTYDLVATSSLGITGGASAFGDLTDVVITGGATGDVVYLDAGGDWVNLAAGTNGQVLKLSGGLPSWGTDLTGSGGAGLWASTTDSLAMHPSDTTDVVVIGSNATTTTGKIFEVVGNSELDMASTTALTVGGTAYIDNLIATQFTTPYSNNIVVDWSGGGDYTTIQGAIDSITNASSTNWYTVTIMPGYYPESITGKAHVNLVGEQAGRGVLIQANSGSLVTFPEDGPFRMKEVHLKMEPTASGAEVLKMTGSVDGTTANAHVVVNTIIEVTSATNGVTASIAEMSSTTNAQIFRSELNYTMTGSSAGVGVHRVFNVDDSAELLMAVYNAQVNISDVDDTVAFFDDSGTGQIVNTVSLIQMNLLNPSYSGLTVGFAHYGLGSIKLNTTMQMYITSLGDGTGYGVYLDSTTNNGLVDSRHGIWNVTGFATNVFSFVGTGDTVNSGLDSLASGMTDQAGAGTMNYSHWHSNAFHLSNGFEAVNASTTLLTNLGNAWFGTIASGTWNGTAIDIGDYTNLTVGATGIELSGDDIALTAGYNIPLSASTTNWNNFYDTPSTIITAGTGLSWTANTINAEVQSSDLADYLQLSVWYATTTHALMSSLPSLDTVGTISTGVWNGTAIDFSDYTNATADTGIKFTDDAIGFDCSEVEGTGINCTGEAITLDATGDWTGTFDGQQGTYYNDLANASGVLAIANGGTATATAPTLGQMLIGNAGGGWDYVASSTLGGAGSGDVGSGTTGQTPYYAGNGTTLTATSSIFIDTTQFIGIGTTSPTAILHVEGTQNATTTIQHGGIGEPVCHKYRTVDGGWFYEYFTSNGRATSTTACE